jgi:hypothetical protein
LNLDKIVRTPYFRSYWIQNNITEMKQYASAVCDLYRNGKSYREERVLLRRAAQTMAKQGDIKALAAMAPEDAGFYAAEAVPDPDSLLKRLRENLLEVKPAQGAVRDADAPSTVSAENAGSATQLDVRIDQAPVSIRQKDAFESLRTLLRTQQPDASLEVFTARAPRDGVFVSLQAAMGLAATRDWDEQAVREALAAALPPELSAGKLGVQWERRSSAGGGYLALDGALPLYAAVNGKQLLLANDSILLEHLLERRQKASPLNGFDGVTYAAVFRHTQEENNFRLLMAQLDLVGHGGETGEQASPENGKTPAFFSGNMASLGRVFSKVQSERIEERDQGSRVMQTVTYQWSQ